MKMKNRIKNIFKKEEFQKFSHFEILFYIIIILFFLCVIFLFIRGIYPEKRDNKRIEDLAILEKALNAYYRDYGKYPEIKEWKCVEKDKMENGVFVQEIKNYILEIPEDPLFEINRPDSKFCYWYKTAKKNAEYKIYAVLEKAEEIYQVYSPEGKMIYTGQLGETIWFDHNWKFRKKMIIDHTKVINDLTDFSLLVYLKDEDLKENARRIGKDIIFVGSEGKKLKKDIENYDSLTGELFAWVKIPFLSSTQDTEIYIYYSNPKTIQVNDKDTWDENFLMIQHFEETSGDSLDSTSNNIDGKIQGNLKQGVEGKISRAYEFDGIDDFVALENSVLLSDLNNITIGIWVLPKQVQEDRGIIGWEGDQYSAWQIIIRKHDNVFRTSISGNSYQLYLKTPLQKDEWHYLTFVYNGEHLISYLDGKEKSIKDVPKGILTKRKGEFAEIGRYKGESWISSSGQVYKTYSFNGLIDQVEISNIARSWSWIKTRFDNQNNPSSFIRVNQQELY
ncbi:DUF2341 domain-containing protein [Candidatus Atribacteria bacterium MT.SAG.1]|nr:DUF2341 domain-containing protein [Candidatus Atribacteria bacterium MT.SAG.1]